MEHEGYKKCFFCQFRFVISRGGLLLANSCVKISQIKVTYIVKYYLSVKNLKYPHFTPPVFRLHNNHLECSTYPKFKIVIQLV